MARSRVFTPSLNIFLGSTPSIAALEMMRQMLDLPAYDRDRVALLFIDIDAPPPAVTAFMQSMGVLGELKTFVLRISVAQNILYADQLAGEIATHTYIPNKIPESFDSGAGGIRNNGHVAACSYHDQIIGLLDKALAQVTAIPSYANPSVANSIFIRHHHILREVARAVVSSAVSQ